MENKTKHNGIISIWKFLFSIMIVILHCNVFASNNDYIIFNGGSIGVEFFFLTSGFLLAASAFKKINSESNDDSNIVRDTWMFIWKKFKSVFPYVFISYILISIVMIMFESHNIYEWISSVWDLLLLRMTGINTNRINAVVWYISAMLLAMIVIYPLLRKYKTKYSRYIAPVIVIFLAGYMSHKFGSLRTPLKWIDFCYKGMFRAFLELNLGIVIYEICMWLKKLKFTKLGKVLLTLVEVSSFISIFLIAQFLSKGTKLDYIMLVILSVGIMIAFSEKSYFYNMCCNKLFYYLERLSLPIYTVQMCFVYLVGYANIFNGFNYYQKTTITLLLTIFVAREMLRAVEFWQKNEKKVFNFFKNKLIVEENNEK